ncbi:MAG: bifunctional tRNA (5-methylaminomethyl-2-thiouridine)(34)-methyltransferase MnmD/FAD-dependent 5-carboxymethylaminomethyl-2-thiouridine(34) oxidoreductase MnmC [Thiomicrospira sp.]|nr:bifunctional tRNA (5-methylaminomethyl-2-thiouridine)(34)-methyltransferase MnmD/FAD-dependent 5-carboxymethylaminomethyl-2-thiouridine(34) oxidoreductase MnmC [Thiomicrospira sp.]
MTMKLVPAKLIWQHNRPYSPIYDDIYFIDAQGEDEVNHVFITPNQLIERFAQAHTFCIAETGFGSGLNFLVTLKHWQQHAPTSAKLHYISVEKHPFCASDLAQIHTQRPQLAALFAPFLAAYPPLLPGWHDIYWQNIRLSLWFGEACDGLAQLDTTVDAWFLDGFAPDKNPDMWRPALYQQMQRLSRRDTRFATFSAASAVRKGLQGAGFCVEKRRGFANKREQLCGHLQQPRPFSSKTPWFSRPEPTFSPCLTVIGGGLAGAAVAHALAEVGWQVTVIESESQPAQHASGNLAGALHPLLTADWNLRSQWYALGLAATRRRLLPWLAQGEIIGDLNGLIDLAANAEQAQRMQSALERLDLPATFVRALNKHQASELLGQRVGQSGAFFAQGGWLNPPSIVARCLAHPNIHLIRDERVIGLHAHQQGWHIDTSATQRYSDNVVVACGAISSLNADLGLPIRPLKGQVSHLRAEHQQRPLRRAVSHLGYSTPFLDGQAVTGATFEAPCLINQPSLQGHQTNLDLAQGSLPDWIKARAEDLDGRVAFRPTTPDHLPIIGPIADSDWLQQAYLQHPPTQPPFRFPSQRYRRGLYVSNGHGARGLLSVFLGAEIIRADLLGTAQCVPAPLYHATHPARFAIRAWRRARNTTQATE